MATLTRPDGAKIFYKLGGKDSGRPPLVMVHGWCSKHELWEQQVKHFGKRHRVLVLDRRGHGRSTTSGSGHDVSGHAADIAAVVKAAGLKGVVAIGHAGGAAGTLEFIRANPRLVRGGVIIDSFLYPRARANDPKSVFGTLVGQMIDALRGPGAKKAFRGWYTGYFDAKGDRAAIRRIVAEAAEVPDTVKIAELEGMLCDTAAIADGIRQPMLWLMAGAQDQAFIAKHFAKVGFAQVYGAAHFPQFEQPAQTNAMIEAYLARL
ncbi:MAG: alpha/beta hydrolase [Gammaproteobacteria bacterium]|nr:alpha/beta hydrolase [Gammaproteobacteria bacterium]